MFQFFILLVITLSFFVYVKFNKATDSYNIWLIEDLGVEWFWVVEWEPFFVLSFYFLQITSLQRSKIHLFLYHFQTIVFYILGYLWVEFALDFYVGTVHLRPSFRMQWPFRLNRFCISLKLFSIIQHFDLLIYFSQFIHLYSLGFLVLFILVILLVFCSLSFFLTHLF